MKARFFLMLMFFLSGQVAFSLSAEEKVARKTATDEVLTDDGSEESAPEPQPVTNVPEGWTAAFAVENERQVVRIERGETKNIFPPENLRNRNDMPESLSTLHIEGYPASGQTARTLLVVRFERGHSQRLYLVDPTLIGEVGRSSILLNREFSVVEKIETVNAGQILRITERMRGVDASRPASYFEKPWFIDCSLRRDQKGQIHPQRPLACQNRTQQPRSY